MVGFSVKFAIKGGAGTRFHLINVVCQLIFEWRTKNN